MAATARGHGTDAAAFGRRLGLSRADAAALAALKTPAKIQDFLDRLPTNHEIGGETVLTVAEALRLGTAHCIEGAFIAACALWMQGERPVLMDLQAPGDDDHVVALFKRGGCWGAISKSNHVWLRWRDPVYRSLRELAMSYFHEYVTGPRKTLRTYSRPFDLRRYDPAVWVSGTESCWDLAWDLDQSPHYKLITPKQARALRPRDRFELHAGTFVEHAKPGTIRKR
ncbi:MAG: hypothetical protein P4M15_07650 [Alphaproteobacteria bacterium]|nr:hypothetical protein [Alphaproteobacteria bacterium]